MSFTALCLVYFDIIFLNFFQTCLDPVYSGTQQLFHMPVLKFCQLLAMVQQYCALIDRQSLPALKDLLKRNGTACLVFFYQVFPLFYVRLWLDLHVPYSVAKNARLCHYSQFTVCLMCTPKSSMVS